MRITKIALISISLLIGSISYSQNRYVEEADQAFEDYKYAVAVDQYKKAYSKVKGREQKYEIRYKMAECYRMMNETKRAEAYYRSLVRTEYFKLEPKVLLYYGQMLLMNEDYDQALEQFKAYNELAPDDPLGIRGLKSAEMVKNWVENPTNHTVTELRDVNSRDDDFSAAYISDQYNTIVFTSNREEATGKRTDNWTGESFTDLFITRLDRKGEWSTPDLLDSEGAINTETNEGSVAMNSTFSTMYFTRCGNAKNEKSGCHIYKSKRTGRAWSDPEILKLGGDSTSAIGHPALSSDEKTIYFAADFENGYGGKDIWYATRKSSSDEFGLPKNAGPKINTKGNEVFPFLRNDTALYFASDGHIGMGGLDIFRSPWNGESWDEPVNMGYPINSNADDFSIVFNLAEYEEGFFSSNRDDGKGGDDIWHFVKPPLVFALEGVIKDEQTLQYVEGAEIKLVGSDGSSIIETSNSVGYYEFDTGMLVPKTSYDIVVTKNGYFNEKSKETTVGLERSKKFVHDFNLEPIPKKPILLPEILYDLAKWDLKPQFQDSLQGLIKTLDENETIVVELASHTDVRDTDERNDILSQKRAQSVVDYLIMRGIAPDRLVAKGYGEHVPRTLRKDFSLNGEVVLTEGTTLTEDYINSLKTEELREFAHQLNRRTEFTVLRTDYVPKASNKDIASTVDIMINPEDNILSFTPGKGQRIVIPLTAEGYSMKATFDEYAVKSYISLKDALDLLRKGAINKNDFEGDPNEILAESSIADQAVVTIENLRIANKKVDELQFVVSHELEEKSLVIGPEALEAFGKYNIDREKNQLRFE